MEFVEGYKRGMLSGMIRLHMRYYGEKWDFGAGFEAMLAKEMGLFLDRFDPRRDLLLTVWEGDWLAGSVVVDGAKPLRAHLRWFIVDDRARGLGLGRRLLEQATGFLDQRGVPMTYLTTFSGLDAAAKLYDEAGFKLFREDSKDRWEGGVTEQMWERPKPRRAFVT